ncbi:hypothetical protein NUW58_g7537 [Xylaria curta]|uniref:Uncharacterized protein n=1 Tax=Xylaria curta TaxID=42375 RepID=A0ACC1NG84_9PEZI|nr:hypothetical protein NUW58_g7537 [Xylaria curta]
MSLTMISSNVAGSTKKQLTASILFIGYCIGNIIGPQTFLKSEAPHYRSAYIAMLVGYSVKLASIVVLYIYMWRVNVDVYRRCTHTSVPPTTPAWPTIRQAMMGCGASTLLYTTDLV